MYLTIILSISFFLLFSFFFLLFLFKLLTIDVEKHTSTNRTCTMLYLRTSILYDFLYDFVRSNVIVCRRINEDEGKKKRDEKRYSNVLNLTLT